LTKLGIISDVHSDLPMLDAALRRMREMGCEIILCAGDLVDGDVFPDEVVARLAVERVPTIRGNHDRWALQHAGMLRNESRRRVDLRRDGPPDFDDESRVFGGGAELAPATLAYLAKLPTSIDLDVEGVRLAVHHARPSNIPNVGDMVGIETRTTSPAVMETLRDLTGADVLIVGHTHERFAQRLPGGLVCNPGALWSGGSQYGKLGSLYVPTGTSYGTFGVLDLPSTRFRVYRAADGRIVLEHGPRTEDRD
jgi:predicted phosphodiesterase